MQLLSPFPTYSAPLINNNICKNYNEKWMKFFFKNFNIKEQYKRQKMVF